MKNQKDPTFRKGRIFCGTTILGMLCFASLQQGKATGPGANAFQFLSLQTNARSESLAGAMTASGNDLSNLNINPAGISKIKYPETLFSQAVFFEDIKFSYLAFAQPTKWGTAALDYMILNYGDFDRIDRQGVKSGTQNPKDTFIGLSWSTGKLGEKKRFLKDFDLGTAVRYVRSDLVQNQATALSFNFGALYKTPLEGLTAGLSLNHFGNSAKWLNDSVSQPSTVRMGLAYILEDFLSSKVQLSLDGVIPKGSSGYIAGSTEWLFYNFLALQIGFSDQENWGNKIKYGMGIGIDAFQLNYSLSPGELGTVHRISARMRFGSGIWTLAKLKDYSIEQDLRSAQKYYDRNIDEKAMIYAKKVLKDQPDNRSANEIVFSIVNKQKIKMSAEIYREALSLYQSRHLNEAFEKIGQSLELDPENKNYHSTYISIKNSIEKNELNRKIELARSSLAALENDFAQFKGLGLPEESETADAINLAKTALAQEKLDDAVPLIEKVKAFEKQLGMDLEKKKAADIITNKSALIENQQITIVKKQEKKEALPKINHKMKPSSQMGSLKEDFEKAVQLSQNRSFDEAIVQLKKIISINKSYPGAAIKLSECLKSRGIRRFANRDYDKSVQDFSEALKWNPSDSDLKKFLDNARGLQKSSQ